MRLSDYANRLHVAQDLTQVLEAGALEYLQPALDGNEDAAFSLICRAGNSHRGLLAVAFWRAKVARPAYRKLLAAAWDHDHNFVTAAAGTRRTLHAMFRYAQFETPEIPSLIKAWRGTFGMSIAQAAKGISWTLDRDVACWFAMRFAGTNRSPLVLAADVPKDSILHFSDERGEREIVVFDKLKVSVDGNQADWQRRFLLFERKKRSETRRFAICMKGSG